MRPVIILLTLMGLAACGADGDPVPPTRDATITLTDDGFSGIARVRVTQGPVSVSLGLGL